MSAPVEKVFTMPSYPNMPDLKYYPTGYKLKSNPTDASFVGPYQRHEILLHNQTTHKYSSIGLVCEDLAMGLIDLFYLTAYVNCISYKGAADALESSPGTVRNRLALARASSEDTDIAALIVRTERIGLTHPEFIPWVIESFCEPTHKKGIKSKVPVLVSSPL